MQALLAPLGELADYQEILKVRKKEDGIIQIAGCVGSQKTHLMYALGDGFEYRVIVFSSEEKAKKAFDEYRIFTDDVYFYPARDLLFYYADIKGNLLTDSRMGVLRALIEKKADKSITVKLGMDSSDFVKEMKKADREIKSTTNTAQNLAKSLDIEFNADVAVQAQKQYQKALEQTEEKAARLREELVKVEKSGGVDSENYSKLQLELAKTEAKAVSLRDKLEEVNNIKIEQFTQKVDDLGNKINGANQKASVLSAVAAGIIAGVTTIGKQAASTGAEIDDMTQRFDISAETVQRWNYIAMQSGVEATTFTNALVKARAAMSDLSSGNANAAADTLQKLGISARQFGSDEEMFDGIIKALANVEDSELQTAYANEIFGNKIATQLLPYINAGAEDLAKWNAEFDVMPSLTGEEAAALATLDDTFNRLSVSMQYATAQLGLAFAPIIERVIEFIEEKAVPAIESFAEWFDGLPDGMQDTILGITSLVAVGGPLLALFSKMTSGVSSLIKMLTSLNKAQLVAAAGFAALAGAGVLAINVVANWKDMSTASKVLSTLAVAALTAAAAVTVFHASWSLGIAVGAIAAGIVAGLAAINAAKDEIVPESPDFTADNIENYAPSGWEDYTSPSDYSGGNSYTDNSYTSSDNINITVNVTESAATAEEIAAAVGKEIATLAQTRR